MQAARIDRYLKKQERLDSLTREDIERIQLEKLNRLLGAQRLRNGFYKDLPGGLGSLGELKELPFTTGRDVAENAAGMLMTSQADIRKIITEHTSGTTGRAKRVFYSEGDCEDTIGLFMAGLGEMTGAGGRVMICMPFSGPGSLGELIAEAIRRIGGSPIRAGAGLSYGAMKEIMERHRPDSCVAMPVQLLSTLRVCGRGTLRSALVSGDSCPAPIAEMIEGILGSRLFHHYGTREMGLGGAVTCPAHEGMHIRENHVIAEIIDDGGRPAALGSPGELVITTIGMEAMPLIRYRTGDRARLMEGRCPCSSSLMRLDTDISRLAGGDAASSAVLKDDRIADYGPEKDGDGIRVLTIGRYDCAKFIKGIFGRQIEVTARPVTMEDAPMYAGKRAPLA